MLGIINHWENKNHNKILLHCTSRLAKIFTLPTSPLYIYITGEDAKEMENGIAHLINNLALRYTVTYILTI